MSRRADSASARAFRAARNANRVYVRYGAGRIHHILPDYEPRKARRKMARASRKANRR